MVQTIISRPSTGAPKARSVLVENTVTGPVYNLSRLLGSSSILALVSNSTNSNLTLVGTQISATSGIGAGVDQVAVVRESAGQLAIEYPVTITGKTPIIPPPVVTPAVTVLTKVAPTYVPPAVVASTASLEQDVKFTEMLVECTVPGDIAYQLHASHLIGDRSLNADTGVTFAAVSGDYYIIRVNGIAVTDNILLHTRIAAGDVMTLKVTKDEIVVTQNGFVVGSLDCTPYTTTQVGGRSLHEVIKEIVTNPNHTYGGVSNGYDQTEMTNVKTTAVNPVYPALTITNSQLVDYYPTFTLNYYGSDLSYQIEVRDAQSGTLVGTAEAAVIVSNDVAGTAVIRAANRIPFSQEGIYFDFKIIQVKNGVATATTAVTRLSRPLSANSVLPNNLVTKSKGPVSAQESFLFDVGTDTPTISYVSSNQCENEVWIWANETRTTGLRFSFLGGGFIVPTVWVDGIQTHASSATNPDPDFKPGDTVDIVTNAVHEVRIYRNGVQVHAYSGGEYTEIIGENVVAGQFVHVLRNTYAPGDQNPQITVSGGNTTPLTLKSSNIDGDGYAFWNIDYVGSPTYGYISRIEDLAGNVINDWKPTAVSNNTIAGKARLTSRVRAASLNVPYNYKFVESDEFGKPKLNALVLTMKRTRPGTPSVGSNIAGIYTPYRKTRTYTNMFYQCYVQDPGNNYSYYDFMANPDKLDFMGNPLVSNLIYQMAGPEKEGNYTLEVTASEGSLLASNLEFSASGGACHVSDIRQAGTNRVLIDVTVDVNSLLAGSSQMFGLIFRNVESTLPKGLFCCETTDDKTKRFYGPYLARLKKINGPMRHMDSNWANEAYRFDGAGKDSWTANRSLRGRIGAQLHGIPLEDIVELSVLTNRPVWFNINHGLLYSSNGRDYLNRSFDLIFNGLGGELGYGVSKLLRHKVENGNENWNFGLGNWHFLAAKAKENGRGSYADGDDGAKHGAAVFERLYNWNRSIDMLMAKVPDYGTFIDRVFGAQIGKSDVSFTSSYAAWPDALARTDRLAIAAYLPGDPNAGYGEGGQPASHSAADVVTWLRTKLPTLAEDVAEEVQYYRNIYNLPTDFYEWNIAFPAIGNRTAAEERLIKSSQVFYDFMKTEYIPAIVPIGGDSCIYSDDGAPSAQQSWYFYESSYTGAGNMSWQALLDFANEHGYTSTQA